MILLRNPALIFLKPHKVGGTSFEIALSRFAGKKDIVTPLGPLGRRDEETRRKLGFSGPRNYRHPWYKIPFLPTSAWRFAKQRRQWPKKFRQHISAAEARAELGPELWNSSAKISITRNPYDAAVSTYFWSRRDDESFADFFDRNIHLLGRNAAQYRIGDFDVIDIYLRYEHLAQDIADMESRFPDLAGLGETFASLSAKSGYRPADATAQSFFAKAPRLRAVLEEKCAREIERFGYRLD